MLPHPQPTVLDTDLMCWHTLQQPEIAHWRWYGSIGPETRKKTRKYDNWVRKNGLLYGKYGNAADFAKHGQRTLPHKYLKDEVFRGKSQKQSEQNLQEHQHGCEDRVQSVIGHREEGVLEDGVAGDGDLSGAIATW